MSNTNHHLSPAEKMREALSLVLLFHSGVTWDSEARAKWEGGLERVFGPIPVTSDTHEATTRVHATLSALPLPPTTTPRHHTWRGHSGTSASLKGVCRRTGNPSKEKVTGPRICRFQLGAVAAMNSGTPSLLLRRTRVQTGLPATPTPDADGHRPGPPDHLRQTSPKALRAYT